MRLWVWFPQEKRKAREREIVGRHKDPGEERIVERPGGVLPPGD